MLKNGNEKTALLDSPFTSAVTLNIPVLSGCILSLIYARTPKIATNGNFVMPLLKPQICATLSKTG